MSYPVRAGVVVNMIMKFYKNTKVMVCSPHGDTDFFDIVTGLLQVDTLTPYLLIIHLDYVHWTSNVFIEKLTLKKQGRRYPAETTTGVDYQII